MTNVTEIQPEYFVPAIEKKNTLVELKKKEKKDLDNRITDNPLAGINESKVHVRVFTFSSTKIK